MKIGFFTYCNNYLQKRYGTHKLINSIKHFHPDIPVYLYEDEQINRVKEKYNADYGVLFSAILLEAKREYNLDYIIHIDSDSLCLGRLDEILKLDYEIASCLNNCDIGDRDERQNRPQCLWQLPNNKYVSCGLTACSSEKFLSDWIVLNQEVAKQYGGVKTFWQSDINWFNYLFHYGNFKNKILDEDDKNLFYGPSANMYSSNNHNPPHIVKEYGTNTWQSWYDIEYKDNDFYLYNKKVKILHQAGGGNKDTAIKCHLSMFNDNIRTRLKEITKIDE